MVLKYRNKEMCHRLINSESSECPTAELEREKGKTESAKGDVTVDLAQVVQHINHFLCEEHCGVG